MFLGVHPAARRGGAVWRPPARNPGDGVPRGRHGVGTEHTRGGKASGRARARAPNRVHRASGECRGGTTRCVVR
eukprot:2056338-Prymnesium_polylepis.2